ncbi:hydroxyacid-oxoacid transhydrogenase [Archaeoglobus veneficus]|uniref:hydroxyacid-oxoacid transhydrogenase n=1 Tax=Archaeoglobus veneficus (strain DSM 11195 / SNP6) TaxID=693661 RepID=F2KQ73_ARCVS|nr:hydroxyacid-oxoacid transhydrogenase [Archaeoglobus veneficus]AEA47676.1 Hydroxyacid-oxoacid transhydrogenase [Archaeoglobus veneficus SNP6]
MLSFRFRAAKAIIGFDTVSVLGSELKKLGAERVMVVTGKNVGKSDVCRKAIKSIEAEGVEFVLWDGVKPEPDVYVIEEGVCAAKEIKPDVFIAVGGGSSIDAAKLINLCTNGQADIYDYIPEPIGKGKQVEKLKPLIAIPTTFGTGSETTCAAVVKLPELNMKVGIIQESMLPSLAIIDGSIEAPKSVAASAGMDALMHAIEAYTCRPYGEVETYFYSGSTPLSDATAEKAIELIGENFIASMNGNATARLNMAIASYMAGMAFGNAGVHIPHAASHAIGGLKHAPHGVCVASTARAVLEFIESAVPEKVRRIAELLKADSAAEGISRLMEEAGIPSLPELGISRDDIPELVDKTLKLKRLLVLCPKPVGETELRKIFEKSL